MEPKSWGVVIGILSSFAGIAFIFKLLKSGIEKDNKILDLEYKNEKQEIKNEVKKKTIDDIIKSLLNRFNKR